MDPPFNPRYVVFARAHGRTAEAQAAYDAAKPTGCMVDFVLWITARWREWEGLNRDDPYTHRHARFDAWLNARYPADPVQLALAI